MDVDALLSAGSLAELSLRAGEAEALGLDGFFTSETSHDPFLPLALAAGDTAGIRIGSCIAVALPRSPMHLAQVGHDLQQASRGRFILGLGSQVRTHVEKRYSGEWSEPVARMREIVLAVRAIWRAWNDGEDLDFRGEFYRHTLMPPFFNPGPTGYGPPPVFMAAVGESMVEAAGEVADGLFVHRFTTARYLREAILPALARGLAKGKRPRSEVTVAAPLFVIAGSTEEETLRSEAEVRAEVAFYAATPAYRPVLRLHGWEELQSDLNLLARRGDWSQMAGVVPDEVLDAFAVRASPDTFPADLRRRFAGDVERVMLSLRPDVPLHRQAEVTALFPARHESGNAV